MKYVKIGNQNENDVLGVKCAHFSNSANLTKMTVKLENGFSLYILGETFCTRFSKFLESGISTCVIMCDDASEAEESKGFVELFNPVGEIVFRINERDLK